MFKPHCWKQAEHTSVVVLITTCNSQVWYFVRDADRNPKFIANEDNEKVVNPEYNPRTLYVPKDFLDNETPVSFCPLTSFGKVGTGCNDMLPKGLSCWQKQPVHQKRKWEQGRGEKQRPNKFWQTHPRFVASCSFWKKHQHYIFWTCFSGPSTVVDDEVAALWCHSIFQGSDSFFPFVGHTDLDE